MEILGIGVGELFLIVLLILILFGPKEMASTGKNLGKWLNRLVHSPTYKLLTRTSDELKNLPRNLMREANLEEFQKEIQQIGSQVNEQTKSIGGSLARSFDEKQVFDSSEAKPKTLQQESPPIPPEEKTDSGPELKTPKDGE